MPEALRASRRTAHHYTTPPMSLLNTLRFILDHPLNRADRLGSVRRFIAWQTGSRLVPGPVAVEFVEGTRLLVSPGQAGATGNIYTGLHELAEMAFVLHMLRRDDLFADIGANIGSYTVLAAGAAGARVVAFEPGARAYRTLCDNVRLNDLASLVETRNEAVGAMAGETAFTQSEDTLNRVALPFDNVSSTQVAMTTLDAALAGRIPTVIKIDVEGYESSVIEGASSTLGSPGLQAVIMETNGSGARYSSSDAELHEKMIENGLNAFSYDAFSRTILPSAGPSTDGNTIYIRDADFASRRLEAARKFSIAGHGFL